MTGGRPARRRLPDFLVIGAQKAGTTSLWSYLGANPAIFMPEAKEPQFFSEDWDRGLDWYSSLFDGARPEQVCGEASTHYSVHQRWPGVPERIASVVPDVRLVYLLRDPLERIRSLHQHRIHARAESRPLEELIDVEPEYVMGGAYASQIEAYLEHVPREQLLVLDSDALREDRAATVDRVLRFLGLPPAATRLPIDTELNGRETRSAYPSWYSRAKRSPVLAPLRSVLPLGTKRRLRGALGRAQPPEASEVPPAVVAQVRERLRDDVARLATLVDPADHPWMACGWGVGATDPGEGSRLRPQGRAQTG